MEWERDVSAGDWLKDRIDDPWLGTMHDVVPRGFEAYARVFHPASRDRPVGAEWPREPYGHRAWDTFMARNLEIVEERVTWAQTAAAMGRTMHAGAQWHALTRFDPRADRESDPRDADGWRYSDPEEGGMPADTVAALADVAAHHTSTPHDGFVAIWEGHGGVVGFMGDGPSRTVLQMGDIGDETLARHNDMLGHSARDVLNNVFRKPTWQEGILSREISEGPRLALPGRDHVLFRGGVAELADPDWVLGSPWRDRTMEAHGFAPDAHAPSIVWPADRAWTWITEVDFDSTIVGGSHKLIQAVCADPRLEALPIREGMILGWDADEINR